MSRHEQILNWRMWPPPPTHKLEPEVPVVALIWWSESEPELIDTVAWGWADEDVYVRINDIRWKPDGVWLHAKHVRRR